MNMFRLGSRVHLALIFFTILRAGAPIGSGKLIRSLPIMRNKAWIASKLCPFNCVLGASELCGFLDARSIRRGLITRNVKDAVDLFHLRFGITFAPALSREFRPYKPDPAPLLHICSTWNIQPNEVMMIGDSLKDDVACGKRAGAFTCLLDQTGRYNSPEYKHVEFQPDYKITSLDEVVKLLEDDFDLAP
ncbi:OLC1v1019495C2 [Oldenlandia corymbosa var. corymbosa]|uniref:OLC1v1019495C2 n=1 Tax=Oldenlandia corymbosa var. corymbosa TaxID=529605 RepID=A0AAV1EE25_OLDCO|nr:OLC1v1019495C2 [Oldenlandia corymbosa var. corymbosa]